MSLERMQLSSFGGPVVIATRTEKITDGVFGRKVNMDLSSLGIELNRSREEKSQTKAEKSTPLKE